MTLFPAIIVFAIVFLSFSKKVLSQPDDSRDFVRPKGARSEALLDPNAALLKYELLQRGLEKKAQRAKLPEY
ncbi:hypothetical protein [Leptothoe kymatousa]|uniref:Uncharacterized protein n=1 Tax=Leptothoe kymatousa TAU-MAC 1615 TaxID=2364775 RepID=A0ABS5Y1J0_9CYAN|nr:hypothetical protein [Leptothoe kymatousa]MBT9311689.1 hypothetical protein [Leptothoe kymatousa TAU-MAC 1615]